MFFFSFGVYLFIYLFGLNLKINLFMSFLNERDGDNNYSDEINNGPCKSE